MSRRLDALFAERVLGKEVFWRCPAQPPFDKRGEIPWYRGGGIDFEIPRYTESLDAAWAGVEKCESISRVQIVREPHGWGVALDTTLLQEGVVGPDYYKSVGKHPALGLVKMCLLAVGVSQEKIDEAI